MDVTVLRRRDSVPRTEHEGSYHSVVLYILHVCGFSARSAEKPHTNDRHVPCCRRQKVRL